MYKSQLKSILSNRTIKIIGIVFCIIILFLIILGATPMWSHWPEVFKPATLALLSGESPYSVEGFFNPPWALIPFIPFAWMPDKVGSAFISLLTLISYGYVAHKMGAKPLVIVAFLLLPQVWLAISQNNVDFIVAIGFILPPQIGLIFISAKPQAALPVIIFWTIEAYREGGLVKVLRTILPVITLFSLSLVLFGSWPTQLGNPTIDPRYDIFPVGVPFGLLLLMRALRDRKIGDAIVSAPLLALYMQPTTYPLAVLGAIGKPYEGVAIIIGLWIHWLIFRYPFPSFPLLF